MSRHGFFPHDIAPPRSRYYDSGRFGRMFGKLPAFAADTPDVGAALLGIGKPGGIVSKKGDGFASPPWLSRGDAGVVASRGGTGASAHLWGSQSGLVPRWHAKRGSSAADFASTAAPWRTPPILARLRRGMAPPTYADLGQIFA